VTPLADESRLRALRKMGVSVVECKADERGHVDLPALMKYIGNRGDITGVLIEGGSKLIGSAVRAGLVDRYVACIATKLIGGENAPGPIGGELIAETMANALKMLRFTLRRSASDIVVDTYLKKD
jgi:diaminohydroxyphosphoribosylaminopyrimidine deaminase/5-amino-6-(5-phosphoribosylamino)uracil reductase